MALGSLTSNLTPPRKGLWQRPKKGDVIEQSPAGVLFV